MGKNKLGMLLIIALLIILLVSLGAGFFLLYTTIKNGSEEIIIVEEKVDRSDITIFTIGEDSITTNLLEGTDGKNHYIKVKVNLGINTSKSVKKEAGNLITLLTDQKVFLEDTILSVCRNKTYEELIRNDAQVVLADEIHTKLSAAFNTSLILEVIINELILD